MNVIHAGDLISNLAPLMSLRIHMNFWHNFDMDVFCPEAAYFYLAGIIMKKMGDGLKETVLVMPGCDALRQLWTTRLALVFPALPERISVELDSSG